MFTPQFFTPTSALFEIACHNIMKNIFKHAAQNNIHAGVFCQSRGLQTMEKGKAGICFCKKIYIYMLTCNLSGEEGSEEKPREGSWGIGCLSLLLGGLRFLTDRLQGQQQGRQKGNLLLQVQGQDQRQTGLQENARIDSHKLQQYVSKIISFCQDNDEVQWNDEKLEAFVGLSCSFVQFLQCDDSCCNCF